MIIPDINISTNTKSAPYIDASKNPLQIAGETASLVKDVHKAKDERDAKAYEIGAKSDLHLYGIQALEESKMEAETPDKIAETFFKKFSERKDEVAKSAPNDLARTNLENTFTELRATFGGRALEDQVSVTQNMRMQTLDTANTKVLSYLRQGGNYNVGLAAIDSNNQDASAFRDPADLQKRRDLTIKAAKTAHLNYLVDSENTDQIAALLKDENFSTGLDENQIAGYKNKVTDIQEANKKMIVDDPVGYLEKRKNISGVNFSVNDAVKIQTDMGINKSEVSVISKTTASQLANQITKAANPSEMQSYIEKIKTSFSDDSGDYSNNAVRDLTKAGLPSDYSYMLQMDTKNDAEELSLMFDAVKLHKDFKTSVSDKLKTNGETYSDFENSLFTSIKDYNEAMLREGTGPVQLEQFKQSTLSLALSHYNKYGDKEKAIKFADNFLKKDTNLLEYDDSILRVPNKYDINEMQSGLETLHKEAGIPATDLGDRFTAILSGGIVRSGRWVAANGGASVRLVRPDNTPILNSEGKRIEYNFDEVLKASKRANADETIQNYQWQSQ